MVCQSLLLILIYLIFALPKFLAEGLQKRRVIIKRRRHEPNEGLVVLFLFLFLVHSIY